MNKKDREDEEFNDSTPQEEVARSPAPGYDPDFVEVEVKNPEMEERLREWSMQGNVENISPYAILYRFLNKATSGKMEQLNRFDGDIPSRHDIGLLYGAGNYYMILTRPGGKNQPRKATSYSFQLGDTYNEMKRQEDQRKVPAFQGMPIYQQAPQQGANSQGSALKDAFGMVQTMMVQMMGLIAPIINGALANKPQAQLPAPGAPDLGVYRTINDLLKSQTKENISFYNEMAKGIINMGPGETVATEEEPEVKKEPDMLDKLLKVIEPFIPLLSQNNFAAKTAAAGFRAVPAVKQVIQDVTNKPDLAKGIVAYVVQKEGPEGARNVLKNMGINPDKYGIQMVMVPESKGKKGAKKGGNK
jgi:hypothetical protein